MNFHILNNKTNKPILKAKLEHFSCHTSATESQKEKIKYSGLESTGVDVVYSVYLSNIEIIDEEALLAFEEQHRLDHTDRFSGEKEQSNRGHYVFVQPKLRDLYSWNITETNYNTK